MNINEILEILPHRYPFLLIDRVIEIEEGKRIVAIKNVSIGEPYFQGHFPDLPLFPGVYMLEAMAQAGGILVYQELKFDKDKFMVVYAGVDDVRFKRPVYPGDQMIIEVEALSIRKGLSKLSGKTFVKNEVASTATIFMAIREIETFKKG